MIDSHWSPPFAVDKPVIGMVHLPALPGAPGFAGDLASLREIVRRDVAALCDGGVHGLMLENFGDVPFFADRVPPATVAHLTAIAAEVRAMTDLPLGINVLRNDALAALSVAHAVGAEFIRVNVLSGARLTDQGIITGRAAELLRLRRALQADGRSDAGERIAILADVNVKHAAPLATISPADETADLLHRAGADGLIVSGTGTGRTTATAEVAAVREAAAECAPVLIGSGVSAENLADYLDLADGFIVGSSLKVAGEPTAPVDADRVKALMARWGERAGE